MSTRITAKLARQWYAEELRLTAHLRAQAVVDAFATVPRERFLGPGPWRISSPMQLRSGYWTTEDDDARHVYHDVLVALDEGRGINNGQPSLWALLFDQLTIAPGEHVLHLGCGTGYYSAIAAELVGSGGKVAAIEVDPALAKRACDALASWPHVIVMNVDGASAPLERADVVIVSAGASHPLSAWVDALKPGGRLLLPMTGNDRSGGILLITRNSTDAYAARFLCPAGFIPFAGARDPEVGDRLTAALNHDRGWSVKSLRRAPEEPDESCWLAGQGWWLSTAPA